MTVYYGVEPFYHRQHHEETVVSLSRTLPVELRVPYGTPVGLEPTTPGLVVLDVLLYDHLKVNSNGYRRRRIPPATPTEGAEPET